MTLEKWLLLPLFLHVLLILVVGGISLRARIKTVVSRQIKLKAIALNSDAWPDEVRKLGNNFDNQFQMPMLWYAVCGLIIVTVKPDWICIGLSWGFLVARVLHSMVHTGSNNVPLRSRMFLVSVACVMSMWAWFAIRLFVIG